MKSKIFLLSIIGVFMSACTDQYSFKTVSILENQSLHDAVLKFFKSGSEVEPRRLQASMGSLLELYVDQNDGKGPGEQFLDIIAGFQFDSLVIEFDTGVKLIHYGEGIMGINPNAIPFNQPRNFFNRENWIFENLSSRKKRLEYEFNYTILIGDFERAK